MSIPLIGLIPAIIFGLKPEKSARTGNAKAMIIVNVVLTVVFALIIFYFYSIISQLATVNIGWFWQ